MIPLRDSRGTGVFPLVTILIIAANVWVFFLEYTSFDLELFIALWALVPALVDFGRFESLLPFITSQFLHAGFFHILSNMWFLWIFGDNVEEHFGKIFYPIVYLASGIVAGFAQYIINPVSQIPMLGASGAVAGILGAYMVLYSRHTIKTLVPFFGVMQVVDIPAGFMLFYWFFTQLFSGMGSLALAPAVGVAFFAHVGGFAAGWMIAKLSSRQKLISE
ncbi:rhomboid family intramembrane serine protease [Candidatus Microgenomates bacterium]|nr:rhomboid family intramembrane serine protease [Candidatus Microgenomates bacterium]